MNQEATLQFLAAEFEAEEKSGFSRIARIPSGEARQFVLNFERMSAPQRALLKQGLAKRASQAFLGVEAPELTAAETEAYQWARTPASVEESFYVEALKPLKTLVGGYRSDKPRMQAQRGDLVIPSEVLAWVDSCSVCTAGAMRRRLKPLLQERYGLTPVNEGGGQWYYRPVDGSGDFEVGIDFGGTWGQQMMYDVTLIDTLIRGVTFEWLMGFGSGTWDFVTEENADRDMELFVELVGATAEMGRRGREIVGPIW